MGNKRKIKSILSRVPKNIDLKDMNMKDKQSRPTRSSEEQLEATGGSNRSNNKKGKPNLVVNKMGTKAIARSEVEMEEGESSSESESDEETSTKITEEDESEKQISVEWNKLNRKQRNELMQNLKNVGAKINSGEVESSGTGKDEEEGGFPRQSTDSTTFGQVGMAEKEVESFEGDGGPVTKRGKDQTLTYHTLHVGEDESGPSISKGKDKAGENRKINDESVFLWDSTQYKGNRENGGDNRYDIAYEAQQNEVANYANGENAGHSHIGNQVSNKGRRGEEAEESIAEIRKAADDGESIGVRRVNWNIDDNNNSTGEEKLGSKETGKTSKTTYKTVLMNDKERNSKMGEGSLYRKNRAWNKGHKLNFVQQQGEDEEVNIADDEMEDVLEVWGFCLVGYIAGDNIGRGAIITFCKTWEVKHKITFDDSGWVIINFESESDRDKILDNGPYIIFKKPFILKPMPALFSFSEEMVSKVPVWIRLPKLPLELWTDTILSKIGSKIGTPLHTDELTCSRERKNFARIFLEIDVATELKTDITLKFSDGRTINQRIIYEYVPSYCKKCKAIGHNDTMCSSSQGYPTYTYKKPVREEEMVGNSRVETRQKERTIWAKRKESENKQRNKTTKVPQYGLHEEDRGEPMNHRGKGKVVGKEDLSKTFAYTRNEVGVGKSNLRTVLPTQLRSEEKITSHVAGDHGSDKYPNPKAVGTKNNMVGVGASNQLCLVPRNNLGEFVLVGETSKEQATDNSDTDNHSDHEENQDDVLEELVRDFRRYKAWRNIQVNAKERDKRYQAIAPEFVEKGKKSVVDTDKPNKEGGDWIVAKSKRNRNNRNKGLILTNIQ